MQISETVDLEEWISLFENSDAGQNSIGHDPLTTSPVF
jgi:hypothetical protein